MTGIFYTAGVICALYYIGILLYSGIMTDFAWIWLFGAVVCAGCGAAVSYGQKHPGFYPGWLMKSAAVLLAVGLIFFGIVCSLVVRGMYEKEPEKLDYIVVLGAHVKGEVPSKALRKRLEQAVLCSKKNPEAIFILSGGQGIGEDITEAECMRRYLSERNIPESHMVLEDRSTTTKENLLFSNELTNCAEKKTGILSNNFHVYRAVKLAEKQGYKDPAGIPASSDPLMQVHYVVREVFALVKEKIAGNI